MGGKSKYQGAIMPPPKKPLKDPNEKNAIQKFVGGKIPHYLAVVAFLYTIGNGGYSTFNMIRSGAKEEAFNKEMKEYIGKTINEQLFKRFPGTTGGVVGPSKKNGTNP